MKPIRKRINEESGAAIVETVMIIPLILTIAAGLLDLSLLIRSEIALDSAATAAVRLCMDNPSCIENEHTLREYLNRVDPLMEEAQVSIASGPEQANSYTHRFYLREDDQLLKRNDSRRTSMPITVELSIHKDYFTPLGKGISLALGGDGALNARALQTGTVDTTRGETW